MGSTTEVLAQPERAEIRIATVLAALGDPVRLKVVRALAAAGAPVACGDIDLPVSPSTRTHHLRTLREAGVISTQCVGTRKMSALRRADLDALYPGMLDGILAGER